MLNVIFLAKKQWLLSLAHEDVIKVDQTSPFTVKTHNADTRGSSSSLFAYPSREVVVVHISIGVVPYHHTTIGTLP